MMAKYAVTALLLVSSEAARVSVLEASDLKSQEEATQESDATSAVVEEHAQSTESVQNATSDVDLDDEFEYELSEPRYAVDGCSKEKDSNPHDMKDKSMSHHDVAAVRCCTDALAGSKSVCHSKNVGCLKQTYEQAEASCARHGMRLCSWFEMKTNLCCSTGCNFDSSLSWIKRGSYSKRPEEYNPNTRPGAHCRDRGALESFFQSPQGGWFSHHEAKSMASKYCQKVQVRKLKTLQEFLKSFEGAFMSAKDASKKAAELLQANPNMKVALFKKQVAYYKSWEGGMQSATVAVQKASDDVRTQSGSHSGSTARRLKVEKDMIAYLKSFDAGMYSQAEAEGLAESYAQFVSLEKLKPMVNFFKSFQAGMMRSTEAVPKALRLLQQHPHISQHTIESKTAHYRSWQGGMKDATTAVNLAIEDAIRETHYSWDHHSYSWHSLAEENSTATEVQESTLTQNGSIAHRDFPEFDAALFEANTTSEGNTTFETCVSSSFVRCNRPGRWTGRACCYPGHYSCVDASFTHCNRRDGGEWTGSKCCYPGYYSCAPSSFVRCNRPDIWTGKKCCRRR